MCERKGEWGDVRKTDERRTQWKQSFVNKSGRGIREGRVTGTKEELR